MIKEADRGQKITCKCKLFICHMVNKAILEVTYLTTNILMPFMIFLLYLLGKKIENTPLRPIWAEGKLL